MKKSFLDIAVFRTLRKKGMNGSAKAVICSRSLRVLSQRSATRNRLKNTGSQLSFYVSPVRSVVYNGRPVFVLPRHQIDDCQLRRSQKSDGWPPGTGTTADIQLTAASQFVHPCPHRKPKPGQQEIDQEQIHGFLTFTAFSPCNQAKAERY